jgi:hypothetical protein
MTVVQLIKQLKKMPQNAIVYYKDHDADDFGISSAPDSVRLINFDNLDKREQKENDFNLTGDVVVICS